MTSALRSPPTRTVRRGRAVLGGDLGQLVGDDPAQQLRVAEDAFEVGDRLAQPGELGLELGDLERDQPAQLHVEHVAGLHVGQPDERDERGARLADVLRAADDPHDLVDVQQRDEQALDQVRPLLRLAQPVARAPGDDVDAVVEEDLEQLLQAERARLAVDERDVVDAEALLERGQPVELGQHRLAVEAGLDLEDQLGAELAVGEVLDVGDALQLLAGDELLDLGDDALGADAVRQLGDGDAATCRGGAGRPRRWRACARRRARSRTPTGPRSCRAAGRRSAGPARGRSASGRRGRRRGARAGAAPRRRPRRGCAGSCSSPCRRRCRTCR